MKRAAAGHSVTRLALVPAMILAIAGCAAQPPASTAAPLPTATPWTGQLPFASFAVGRIVCGSVPRDSCEQIVRLVVQGQPALAASPLAVVDFGGQGVVAHYGSDAPVLVALQPVGDRDYWMNPPTWVVTGWQPSEGFSLVQEWRVGPLPADFASLLRSAGLE